MDINKIKLKREYLSGIHFTDSATRKYKYTIVDPPKDISNTIFYSETYTKQLRSGEWGKGETLYYINGNSKPYKTLKGIIKSMLK